MKIKVIGIGGGAEWLLPLLRMYLEYGPAKTESVEITLVDGKQYAEKKRDRQSFHRLGNKAEVKAEYFRELCPKITWKSLDMYVTEKNISRIVRENDFVFCCVDNHKSRKVISDRTEELENAVLFSGGNEMTDGNIQVFIRKDGENVTLPLASKYHEEILYPRDKSPDEMSCEELGESEPQLCLANNMIATLMANAFYGYLEGKNSYDEAYMDIIMNAVRPINRSRT
jgi:molybdopterin/thiamine biosynthesis adenylyltransferase